jgi:hypothetical protein
MQALSLRRPEAREGPSKVKMIPRKGKSYTQRNSMGKGCRSAKSRRESGSP